jgi:hypothetical protein
MRCLRLLAPIFFVLIPSLLAQSIRAAKTDPSPSSNSSVPAASVVSSNSQGPILAALGKHNSGYWIHPSAQGFRGENSGLAHAAGMQDPSVIDPWIQQAMLTASDAEEADNFGISVAVDGNTAVVGAYERNGFQGAAYVFVANGDGTWSQQAELTASDGGMGDFFGWSVAVSGNTVVVGAFCHPSGTFTCFNPGPGAAYVFVRNGTTWSQQAELTASDGVANDCFGFSVAVSGGTAVVGAFDHNADRGAAYVFAQDGTTWSQQAELTASDGAVDNSFGWSVAVSGNIAVVGADYHAVGSNPYQGAAYVFVQNGSTWSQQAELTASDGVAWDRFGFSVGVSGSTAVVGAFCHPAKLDCDTPGPGAAYVFVANGDGTWSQQAELTASDGMPGDMLGYSIGISGSTIVAGAQTYPVGSNQGQGTVYIFGQDGSTWSQQAELTGAVPTASQLGLSVAVSGSTVLAGANGYSVGSNLTGAAFVFGSSGPLYTLSPSPSSVSFLLGSQSTATITITPYNGFSGNVLFSTAGLPGEMTAEFSPNPSSTSTTMTLTASPFASPRAATVTVIGTSGNLTQTTTLTLRPTRKKRQPGCANHRQHCPVW